MDFGFTAIPAIAIICYVVAEAIKVTPVDNKWLPIICMLAGGGLGVVAIHIMPDFPAADYLTAIAVGIASGLAATGVHQIGRQLAKE